MHDLTLTEANEDRLVSFDGMLFDAWYVIRPNKDLILHKDCFVGKPCMKMRNPKGTGQFILTMTKEHVHMLRKADIGTSSFFERLPSGSSFTVVVENPAD